MKYGSICSGVEAATLAWSSLGWKAVFFAEVEPFPSAVLCYRFKATRPLRPLDPALPRLSHSHQRCCVIDSKRLVHCDRLIRQWQTTKRSGKPGNCGNVKLLDFRMAGQFRISEILP